MLRLIRLSSFESNVTPTVSAYKDESLWDIAFNFGGSNELSRRPLTKFRAVRKSGAVASFELRGGVVCGVELLGVERWDAENERFSEEIPIVREIPRLGMELDGSNTQATLSLMSIDQPFEFTVRWATAQRALEIGFGDFYSASVFECGSIMFNQDWQVTGIRIKFPDCTMPSISSHSHPATEPVF